MYHNVNYIEYPPPSLHLSAGRSPHKHVSGSAPACELWLLTTKEAVFWESMIVFFVYIFHREESVDSPAIQEFKRFSLPKLSKADITTFERYSCGLEKAITSTLSHDNDIRVNPLQHS